MRPSVIVLAGLVLAGCATAVPAPQAPVRAASQEGGRIDALPPQNLPDGECGLFFWTSASPHRFIVYENESRRAVKLVHDGEIIELGVVAQTVDMIVGDSFERLYPAPSHNLVFSVTGTIGERTRSGTRIERALLRVEQPSGAEIVQPVLGLRTCRTGSPVTPSPR